MILVVDDDKAQRELYVELLGGLGYEVVEARNGIEAAEALERQRPAAILLDLSMPLANGYDFLTRLRANPEHAAIRVIVVSGTATGTWSLNAGADAFLMKPVGRGELTAALRRIGLAA